MDKTTEELLEMMKNANTYADYMAKTSDSILENTIKPSDAITALLSDKKMKKADVIAKSTIEQHYAYQLFSGDKTPSRDKMIMFCFGFDLSLEETQNLLKTTGYSQLYGKNLRDNAIIFALVKKLDLWHTNEILNELGLDCLE